MSILEPLFSGGRRRKGGNCTGRSSALASRVGAKNRIVDGVGCGRTFGSRDTPAVVASTCIARGQRCQRLLGSRNGLSLRPISAVTSVQAVYSPADDMTGPEGSKKSRKAAPAVRLFGSAMSLEPAKEHHAEAATFFSSDSRFPERI